MIFSEAFISDADANLVLDHASSTIQEPPQSSNTKSIESQHPLDSSSNSHIPFDPAHETYELMYLNGKNHLCIIPIVDPLVKNETSEAEARIAEQKELARATNRGWELLQELEGNCLYFVSGWWSYSFCYNSEIRQYHQLPPQPGKPAVPPQPDPATKEFVLGRAKPRVSREDEWGNQIDVRKAQKQSDPPKTELQVKGDTRYLVQKMEGGTACDLTGRPRRVEVQYHCNPHITDRIGYIKEVTTCSYLMVIYTPRLCNDVAFLPPKENKVNSIVCRVIVPEEESASHTEQQGKKHEIEETTPRADAPINIGGLIIGAGKWADKSGQRMPIPANFGQENQGQTTEIIARGKSKVEGGQIEVVSDAELQKLDLDPEMVQNIRKEVQKLAQDAGWHIKVINNPGQVTEIMGVVDGQDEVEENDDADEEGSEEVYYKDEL